MVLAVGWETVVGLLEKAILSNGNLTSQCEMVGALDEAWLGVFLLCVWFDLLRLSMFCNHRTKS